MHTSLKQFRKDMNDSLDNACCGVEVLARESVLCFFREEYVHCECEDPEVEEQFREELEQVELNNHVQLDLMNYFAYARNQDEDLVMKIEGRYKDVETAIGQLWSFLVDKPEELVWIDMPGVKI